MIISWLTGGLGNQMFQYAAGLALAERRRTILKLDVSWYREYAEHAPHNRYALSGWNVNEQFATAEEIDRVRGVRLTRAERWALTTARWLRLRQWSRRFDGSANHYVQAEHAWAAALDQQPDPTYLQGMFQAEAYFASSADLVRRHFTLRYPPGPEVLAWVRQIQSGPSLALHVRRGDYVANPEFTASLGPLSWDYCHRAVAQLRAHSPAATLYIFSDDIETVAANFQPDGTHHFVHPPAGSSVHENLYLMSQCEHIAVANSTFSWWAAWLNPQAEKVVIAPDPWFVDQPVKSQYIVPESWIKLPR